MAKIGIDIGSRFVKIVYKSEDKLEFKLLDTITFYKNFVKRDGNRLEICMKNLFDNIEIKSIVATGYGRNMVDFENSKIISEIKAHFKGALETMRTVDFTLIDVGGQDSKVIFVKDGFINDFVMNDKCAASTGRFMENAANILGIELDELSSEVKNPVKMNSVCAIFSESEIIGKLAEGYSISEIAAGVNESVAKRIFPMLKRFKNEKYYLSGGVALFTGVKYFLEKLLDDEIELVKYPQYNGAIGCLFY